MSFRENACVRLASIASAVAIALMLAAADASAALITKGFKWTGTGGYTAEGVITYDDSFAIVSGFGLGGTTGIEALSVSFFDPTNTLLSSQVNVAGGVSSYASLLIIFDTASMQFSAGTVFNLGSETAGEHFLLGTILGVSQLFLAAPDLNDSEVLDAIPTGTMIDVFALPAPATLTLFGLGLMGLGVMGRRRFV